jgi:hypothetical protein
MLLALGMGQDTRSALFRLAESQCGLFSAAQAASIGISHAELFRAVRQAHLRRPRSGVYAICGAPNRVGKTSLRLPWPLAQTP